MPVPPRHSPGWVGEPVCWGKVLEQEEEEEEEAISLSSGAGDRSLQQHLSDSSSSFLLGL